MDCSFTLKLNIFSVRISYMYNVQRFHLNFKDVYLVMNEANWDVFNQGFNTLHIFTRRGAFRYLAKTGVWWCPPQAESTDRYRLDPPALQGWLGPTCTPGMIGTHLHPRDDWDPPAPQGWLRSTCTQGCLEPTAPWSWLRPICLINRSYYMVFFSF